MSRDNSEVMRRCQDVTGDATATGRDDSVTCHPVLGLVPQCGQVTLARFMAFNRVTNMGFQLFYILAFNFRRILKNSLGWKNFGP